MPTDLQKLTVPQLKALCKEKGISGYSKLSKAFLIEKLTTHAKGDIAGAAGTAANQTAPQPPGVVSSGKEQSYGFSQNIPQVLQSSSKALEMGPLAKPPVVQVDICSVSGQDLLQAGGSVPQSQNTSKDTHQTPQLQKRLEGDHRPPLKKQRINETRARGLQEVNNPPRFAPPLAVHIISETNPVVIQTTNGNRQNIAYTQRGMTTTTSKRYIPLAVKSRDQAQVPATDRHPATNHHEYVQDIVQIEYLDFPLMDETKLEIRAITFPPSLSQRKCASRLALILRDIDARDMPSLALSSRLFRYSGYLSASFHLQRWYPGKRLEKILDGGVSADRMNLWSYRVARETEMMRRKKAFKRSFLGGMVGGNVGIVGESVWRSGNCSKQAAVAVRFLLTRCYFIVSLGRDLKEMSEFRISDVREVGGGIWCVVTYSRNGSGSMRSIKYYVLETTCEVIGSPVSLDDSLPTRVDWSVYVREQVYGDGRTIAAINLMEYIRWTNHEEYDHGISKLWLRRTQEEGEFGEFKRAVARRYMLACTMENSLSGRYMTSSEMGQELNGLPSKTKTKISQERKGPKINLFVPAHHHVESVHFTTRSGHRLHPALAIVQTPSREYYILKDNGMQVGCEEEGIASVWMEIIECSGVGEPRSR